MRVPLPAVRRVVMIPALAGATVISAALLVLAAVVTGPVSLCLRGRWRPVRLGARQAARLGHVLPPRPSGTLSAIEAAPQADLVIVAHTGLDHLDSAAAVWNGIPLQRPLRVTWWRVPAGDVPSGKDARTEWLNAQWARVDDWIAGYAASSRSKNER